MGIEAIEVTCGPDIREMPDERLDPIWNICCLPE
jgi:hypothetical protein